ncbi:hypothetical protein M758_4G256000 [Ceratodon purpureus]|nr:hypothetical protein M758_4G256000 [Ceratodon purpureus]
MVRGGKERRKKVEEVDFGVITGEARKQVWSGAVPLQLHLHPSEITASPAPAPFLILAPRNGYLPLLETDIRHHFARVIPSNSDSIWFDYQGLPLKWHIPTGVLYDLLVAEFERPWNLTVHFRAYPTEVLTLCEDEAVKWNFVNALKEASYVMYGNTKSIMNMSQLDQVELWRCVIKGELEGYDRIAARLRPGFGGGGNWVRDFLLSSPSDDGVSSGPLLRAGSDSGRPSRVPVRVYVRTVDCDLDDLLDAAPVLSWDEVVYTTRPIDLRGGNILTVRDALLKMVPHLFSPTEAMEKPSTVPKESSQFERPKPELETEGTIDEGVVQASTDASTKAVEDVTSSSPTETVGAGRVSPVAESDELEFEGIIRIQGIEPSLDLPLEWVARNLCGPENFIHFIVISRRLAPQLPSRAID